jgi:hypothetical protein
MGEWYRRREGQVPHWLPPWLQRRTGTAIGKRLHSSYKRQLALASREAFRLQRTVFAAILTTPGDLLDPGFYAASRAEAPYLLEALANHRSAGIPLAKRARQGSDPRVLRNPCSGCFRGSFPRGTPQGVRYT